MRLPEITGLTLVGNEECNESSSSDVCATILLTSSSTLALWDLTSATPADNIHAIFLKATSATTV
eukprot:3355905-Amphidinium_carterae.1